MTTKIKSISIAGIRGIKDSISLPLNEKSVLLYGDNGTGKSSISDAIEWFYTDKVSHLSGSEIDLKDALRNSYQKDTDAASIAISYKRNAIDATKNLFKKRGKLTYEISNSSDDFQKYYSASQNENLLLRYQFLISWELMVERLNSDLANTLGNLVNRTVSMTNKYFGGTVEDKGVVEDVDAELKAVVENASKAVDAKMADLRVADAITEIFNLFKRCNKYIDETTPWVLGKDESKKDRLSTVLWNLIQSISEGARLLESFMPSTSKKILEQLGNGHVTEKPEILFQRMDLEEVMKKVEELHPKVEEKKEEEAVIDIEPKDEITFEQFGAMQFQVGEIIACEAVKKSKKLLCSQVKVGSQVKQIVSGIKAHYTPEEMVGKKVMVLVNLKPAKLAGVLSEGMLLCAEDAEGNLALMTPEKEMPAGAEIC